MPSIQDNLIAQKIKLVCPVTKEELIYEEDKLVSSKSRNSYPIVNSIPVLLPEAAINNSYEMDYIEHYQKDAELFDYFEERICKATVEDERRLREYIISLVNDSSNEIVLDVGSGSAWVAEFFCKRNKTVISFDIAIKNIEKALERFPYKNHFGLVGDALQPPFIETNFDTIIASEIIEHIVEPELFLNRLFSLLKKEGKLIISTPYNEVLHYSQCIHCGKLTPKNAHLHSFDEKKMSEYAKKIGCKKFKFFKSGNKALLISRAITILRPLPFPLWKIIDKIFNLILDKPAHLIAVFEK